jgi:hypothetical protein
MDCARMDCPGWAVPEGAVPEGTAFRPSVNTPSSEAALAAEGLNAYWPLETGILAATFTPLRPLTYL